MRVLFLANPGVRDTPPGEHYEKGKVYDLTPDRAYKWMTVLAIAIEVAVEAPPDPPTPVVIVTMPPDTPTPVAIVKMPPDTPGSPPIAAPTPLPRAADAAPGPPENEIPISTAAPRSPRGRF